MKLKYPKMPSRGGGEFAAGFASSFVPAYTSAFAEANRNRSAMEAENRARDFARERAGAARQNQLADVADERSYTERQAKEARDRAAWQRPMEEAAKYRAAEEEAARERRAISTRAYAEPAGKFAAIRRERRMKPDEPLPDELLGGSKRSTRPTADQLTIEGARALLRMAQDPNTAFLLTEEQKALAGELMARAGQQPALRGGPEVGGDPKEALRQRVIEHARARGFTNVDDAARDLKIDPASLD